MIRIIGPDCYARRDPVGHAAAYERFQAEERQRRDIAYLISRLPIIPNVLRTLGASLNTIRVIDTGHHRRQHRGAGGAYGNASACLRAWMLVQIGDLLAGAALINRSKALVMLPGSIRRAIAMTEY